VFAGFPIDLFLTLSGVTLLFAQAHVNGTLDIVAHNAIRLCRGRVGVVPIMYFGLGAALASAGPGNIATTGLLAPMAMATALRMRISPFLMAIMVGNGANSGSLSPFAPTGIIVTNNMTNIGLAGFELQTWGFNLLAHALVAFAGYFAFGGLKLLTRDRVEVRAVKRLDGHQIARSRDRAPDRRVISSAARVSTSAWRRSRARCCSRCCSRPMTARPSSACRGARS
jgi:Na+/H+ antiporter NhaD/arsenite permease-like protein